MATLCDMEPRLLAVIRKGTLSLFFVLVTLVLICGLPFPRTQDLQSSINSKYRKLLSHERYCTFLALTNYENF